MSKDSSERLRRLPAIEKLVSDPLVASLGAAVPRSILLQAARSVVDRLRERSSSGEPLTDSDLSLESVAAAVRDTALRMARNSLRRAINATGIILHTGLGRAVLSDAAREAVMQVASGHSTLEIDIESGSRGSRSAHYSCILSQLCGAEAALAVNNNAGAVLLALNTIALGREIIVSRGQLVEIGGSFRMPEIMSRAGAKLVEVGTTNRTRISDYELAITENTGMLLRVHPSNFRIVGFAQDASLFEISDLGKRYSIPVMDDLGSGALLDLSSFGMRAEPLVAESLRAGADIVTFSGDKLMGGPQAGLIVGRRELVDAMAVNPLARALRLDKLVLAALEATLRLYLEPETLAATLPSIRCITRPADEVTAEVTRLKKRLDSLRLPDVHTAMLDGSSEVGGGSLPGEQIPTTLLAVTKTDLSPDAIALAFRHNDPPILGRVANDAFLLDLRTVLPGEPDQIVKAASGIFQN